MAFAIGDRRKGPPKRPRFMRAGVARPVAQLDSASDSDSVKVAKQKTHLW